MDGWRISWNFDKESYSSGESASISIWLENNSNFPLHVSEVAIAFDFGTYYLKQFVGGSIHHMNANFLGSSSLCIPDSIVERRIFKITYRAYWFINNNWVDQGYFTTKLFL
jgi:hypothetical protein